MRRAVFALTVVLVIVLLMESLTQFGAVEANPYSSHKITQPTLVARSPSSQFYGVSSYEHPFIYRRTSFNITLNYMIPNDYTQVDSFLYKIDNSPIYPLNITSTARNLFGDISYLVFNQVENLSSGVYNLKAYAKFVNGTTTQIMDSYVKIDLTPALDPLFPLTASLIVLVVLSLTTILFTSKKIKRIKTRTHSK